MGVGEAVTAYGTADATDPTQLDALFVTVTSSQPPAGAPHLSVGPGTGPVRPAWNGHGPDPWTAATTTGVPVDGTVTAINGDDITLTERSGTTMTVVVSSTTTYRGAGAATTEAAVSVGDDVVVYGTVTASGDLVASAIIVWGMGADGWQSQASSPWHLSAPSDRSGTATSTPSAASWAGTHPSGFAGPHQGYGGAPSGRPTEGGGRFGQDAAGAHDGGSPGTGPGGGGPGQR